VVVDDGAAFVGVVVRASHDAATTGLDGLGRGVDVVCLDADDDLPGNGMVDLGGQCQGDRSAVRAAKWAPSRNFSDMPGVSL
jgi:hypothetical protein